MGRVLGVGGRQKRSQNCRSALVAPNRNGPVNPPTGDRGLTFLATAESGTTEMTISVGCRAGTVPSLPPWKYGSRSYTSVPLSDAKRGRVPWISA